MKPRGNQIDLWLGSLRISALQLVSNEAQVVEVRSKCCIHSLCYQGLKLRDAFVLHGFACPPFMEVSVGFRRRA